MVAQGLVAHLNGVGGREFDLAVPTELGFISSVNPWPRGWGCCGAASKDFPERTSHPRSGSSDGDIYAPG